MPNLNSQQLGLFSFNLLAELFISTRCTRCTDYVYTSQASPIHRNTPSDTNVFYFKRCYGHSSNKEVWNEPSTLQFFLIFAFVFFLGQKGLCKVASSLADFPKIHSPFKGFVLNNRIIFPHVKSSCSVSMLKFKMIYARKASSCHIITESKGRNEKSFSYSHYLRNEKSKAYIGNKICSNSHCNLRQNWDFWLGQKRINRIIRYFLLNISVLLSWVIYSYNTSCSIYWHVIPLLFTF